MSALTKTEQPFAPISYRELVSDNRDFRYLWFGQIVSLLGDWFNLIASAALIAALTQTGAAIGALFVVRMLAPFLVSPIAGVVADRYNRKQILIVTDIVRAVVVFAMLLVRNADQVWLLYTLTAVQLGISGFFFPTRNAILPDVVPPRAVGAANALSSATWSVMLALGAAIGGLVSGLWGIYPAFIIDGLTFILSAFFIAQIRYKVSAPADGTDQTVGAALRQYIDGLRYLGRFPDVLVISLHKAAIAFFMIAGFQVVQVVIAEDIFPYGQGGGYSMGMMFAVLGVGSGLGPVLARYFTGDRDRALRQGILVGYLFGVIGYVIVAPLFSFPLVLVGLIMRGVGGGIVWVFSTQLLLQLVPAEVRGRVFATEFAFFSLLSAVAAYLVGRFIDTVNIPTMIWWMAGSIILPGLLWIAWLARGHRGNQTPDEVETVSA